MSTQVCTFCKIPKHPSRFPNGYKRCRPCLAIYTKWVRHCKKARLLGEPLPPRPEPPPFSPAPEGASEEPEHEEPQGRTTGDALFACVYDGFRFHTLRKLELHMEHCEAKEKLE